MNINSLLKNAVVAFFNLAKGGAKPRTARKTTTGVAILASHPCDDAACRILQRAVSPTNHLSTRDGLWLWPAGFLTLVVLTAAGVVAATAGSDHGRSVNIGQLLDEVGIEPKPNARVPLDVVLSDERGAEVRLADLCAEKPVVLALVYYRCPMLCSMTMDGLVRGLSDVTLNAGGDFTVLCVSFDPREAADLAAAAKRTALARYGRPGADSGWRFLTGDDAQVRRLADSVGFHYRYDEATGQYAHAAGLIVLAPGGVVSRYLYGIEFPARDLRLALVEASTGRVGSAADRVLLLCYHYDPATGKYGLAILHVLRLAGLATVAGLGLGIGLLLYHERRRASAVAPPSPSTNDGLNVR